MRVLFYYPGRQWTGSARAFADAGGGLVAREHQVTYVCPANGPVAAHAAAQGCEVIPLNPDAPWALSAWQLQRILADRFVETVFVHMEREQIIASLAVRLAGRGGVVRRTPAGTPLIAGRTTRWALRLASGGFVFTTEAEAKNAPVLEGGFVREPIIADLGVDVERYRAIAASPTSQWSSPPLSDQQIVVCVYDPSGKRRAATALRTIALLRPRHPDLHLVFVGPDSQNEDLRMHAAALGLTRAVSFLGDRDDQKEILRTAVLGWVVAGGDDGVYSVLDLMAMATPVVLEQGSVGQRYIADGITGESLTAGDAAAAAAVIAELLSSAERREAMGNAGRVRVARDFSAHAMVSAMERAAESGRDRARWNM